MKPLLTSCYLMKSKLSHINYNHVFGVLFDKVVFLFFVSLCALTISCTMMSPSVVATDDSFAEVGGDHETIVADAEHGFEEGVGADFGDEYDVMQEFVLLNEATPSILSNTSENAAKKPKSPTQFWKEAIWGLHEGKSIEAKAALLRALDLKPKFEEAKKLLKQIDTDPVEFFGNEFFSYAIAEGESLSIVAKRYLDDPFLFYILARYNDIENPSRIIIGQTIKIPKQNQAPSVAEFAENKMVKEAEKVEQDSFSYDLALMLFEGGNYLDAITLLETSIKDKNSAPTDNKTASVRLLVSSYVEQAKTSHLANQTNQIEVLLLKAQSLDPNNREVIEALGVYHRSLDEKRRKQSNATRYRQGLSAFDAKKYHEALIIFQEVVASDPTNKVAQDKVVMLNEMLIDKYYERAFLAQRHHELDKAIDLWDKILTIDPIHKNARLFRAKAFELKRHLSKFIVSTAFQMKQ